MDINIRLPCNTYITVKVDKNDTILLLKEKLCLTNILFIKEHFHLYLQGQEQPLHDELSLLSLPDTPFLQKIPDTLASNISPTKSIRVYTSSNIQHSTCIHGSPIKPNVPSVPKAVMRKKSFQYKDTNHDGCMIL